MVSHLASLSLGRDVVILGEYGPYVGGRHPSPGLASVGHSVAHEAHLTALLTGAEHSEQRDLDALASIGDHEFHPAQTAQCKPFQKGSIQDRRTRYQ